MAFAETISPEELLRSVKPQDPERWRRFVEEHVHPIQVLAEAVAGNFEGDPSVEVARIVSREAKRVLEVSNRVLGPVEEGFEAPNDPIEAARQLVEKSANTFLGVDEGGKYTLFAWTLRKITREYFGEIYRELDQDEEAKQAVFQILGVKELFKPRVRSALADRLTLLGYPDYLSLGKVEEYGNKITISLIPAREKTLGGAICRFVDSIVSLLRRPGILSGIELSVEDPVEEYLKMCKSIAPIPLDTWSLHWKHLTEPVRLSSDYVYLIEGFGVKIADSLYSDGTIYTVEHETNLLTLMRKIAPSLVLGTLELVMTADGRLMMLLKRKRET
ncbi:hypothetical protein A3L12_07215 [Thermococcus sp. P6]|uniref:hypothetical protein n=1 Tax=Thermococcus sp. P6 TaxID=122420 RepID=UPI000B59DB0C|nr:hypothetical protein [Thermococcus sp. P6]ASJ11102.1 hypothetical protein A3L12_07215 [Thermococcus sp. P6]